MHSAPSWVETMREVIFFIVWAVLILRFSTLWRPRQRPAWIVLAALSTGSVVIQADVRRWIDHTTGVEGASELIVALTAIADFGAVWWFALELHRAAHPARMRRLLAPVVAAGTMAIIAIALFFVTPPVDRFGEQAHGWWILYAIAWIGYGATTAASAAFLFWRHGITMSNPTLRVSMLVLSVGVGAELPYLVIRAVRWFSAPAPELALASFWCSFARFVIVALGCSLAALDPLRKALLHWQRRQRLYGLWLLLRRATPELALEEPRSRLVDMTTFGNTWEELHQRVVEIRDSIAFLYDSWATPHLLQEAREYAAGLVPPERARPVAISCWLEATRRMAIAEAPKRYHKLDPNLLPDVCTQKSTMHREVQQMSRLYRDLRSQTVRNFAERQESLNLHPS